MFFDYSITFTIFFKFKKFPARNYSSILKKVTVWDNVDLKYKHSRVKTRGCIKPYQLKPIYNLFRWRSISLFIIATGFNR